MKLLPHRHRFHGRQGNQPIMEGQAYPDSLIDVQTGHTVVVQQLHGGREFVNRLAGIGFTIGAQVTVISNPGHGPIVVSIRGAHVALGRQEATRIQVMTE